uniref:Putative group i salivary lipocalin n=1 Tax=Rhipicephalus pulchellus TaxID=72859 RepID=L7LT44_RHIPC
MITRDLLFVVLLATSYMWRYSFSIFIKDNEFKEFLDTSEPIWTYNTTNKWNHHWCAVDVTERLQKETIEYRHTYYVKFPQKQKTIVQMRGAFKYQNNLVAGKIGSKVLFKDHLIYMDSDKVCAVVRVSPQFSSKLKPWHELRIRNKFLLKYRRPSLTCAHYFNLEAKQGRLVYHPVCQKIIYKAHSPQQKTIPVQRPQLPFRNTSV